MAGRLGQLKQFIQWNCKIAICVVEDDKPLGPAALDHPTLNDQEHEAAFSRFGENHLACCRQRPKPVVGRLLGMLR